MDCEPSRFVIIFVFLINESPIDFKKPGFFISGGGTTVSLTVPLSAS